MVLPTAKKITYYIELKRVIMRDGWDGCFVRHLGSPLFEAVVVAEATDRLFPRPSLPLLAVSTLQIALNGVDHGLDVGLRRIE